MLIRNAMVMTIFMLILNATNMAVCISMTMANIATNIGCACYCRWLQLMWR